MAYYGNKQKKVLLTNIIIFAVIIIVAVAAVSFLRGIIDLKNEKGQTNIAGSQDAQEQNDTKALTITEKALSSGSDTEGESTPEIHTEAESESEESTKESVEETTEGTIKLTYDIVSERYSDKAKDGVEVWYQYFEYPIFSGDGSEAINAFLKENGWSDHVELGYHDTFGREDIENTYIGFKQELNGASFKASLASENNRMEVVYLDDKYVGLYYEKYSDKSLTEYTLEIGGYLLDGKTGKSISYKTLLPADINVDQLFKDQGSSYKEIDIDSWTLIGQGLVFYFGTGSNLGSDKVIIPFAKLKL